MAQMGLCTFLNAHFQVNGIAYDVHLNRIEVVEQVTIVPIVVANGIIVFLQAFVHLFLVVDVTFFHTQGGIQVVGSYYGITYPCDVSQIVALSFVQFHKDIHMLFIDSPYGVFQNGSVAITQFVVFIDECLLGFIVTFWSKFLGFE